MTHLKIISKKRCSFCSSEEGKLRPVGNYVVKLKEIVIQEEVKLACQGCYVHNKVSDRKENHSETTLRSKLVSYLSKIKFP